MISGSICTADNVQEAAKIRITLSGFFFANVTMVACVNMGSTEVKAQNKKEQGSTLHLKSRLNCRIPQLNYCVIPRSTKHFDACK